MAVEHYGLLVAVAAIAFLILKPLSAPKALRQLPSASPLAPFTTLWLVYHNWHGRRYLAVEEAHRKHGSAIRISPNQVSFSSPQAYKDIYGHGVPILKDIFYDNLAGDTPAMADSTNKEIHSAKRRTLAGIFAAKNITAMEPKAQNATRDLLHAIEMKAHGKPVSPADMYPISNVSTGEFDLRPWLNMFSFDAFSDILWSLPFGFLKRGTDECLALGLDQKTTSVRAMQTFQTGVHFNTLCAQFAPALYSLLRRLGQTLRIASRQNADHFTGMVRYRTVQRLTQPPAPPAVDIFSFLPTTASDRVPSPMTLPDIVAECTSFLNAGNDTTQISLTNTLFELAANPTTQHHLHATLVAHLPATSRPTPPTPPSNTSPTSGPASTNPSASTPPCASASRAAPPAPAPPSPATPSPPTSPSPPPSTPSTTTPPSSATPCATAPERWLPDHPASSDQERQHLRDFVLPFTLGPRACIGRNLAYMEMSICLAALVMKFEFRVSEAARTGYRHFERFNCSPRELMVSVRVRE
ncbi:Cytochrome-P450 [Teratosphaeria destructans]|uniref:Cytochrome-P450 n=1 Tax=Teratosphaeria destructans TaxID=418781 RepID=A0A9W7SWM5_9PEZI|nr:Cytochrome-P450 [Teratosphaeria destructans]